MRHASDTRWVLAAGIFVAMLVTWLAVEALGVGALTNPALGGSATGAAAGVALLVTDAVIPVPSSVVMVALGAFHGVAAGIALCLLGRVGGAALGFAIGRRGGSLLQRVDPTPHTARPARAAGRTGAWAIALTRPVPLISETTMIAAGASSMSWTRALLAALAGSIPEAAAYSAAGSMAARFELAAAIWGGALLGAAALWLLVSSWRSRTVARTGSPA